MRRTYAALLCLYPAKHRTLFGEEMLDAIEQVSRNRLERGWAAAVLFHSRELAGLLCGLTAEWTSKWIAGSGYLASVPPPEAELKLPETIWAVEEHLRRVLDAMVCAISNHDFPKARFYSEQERVTRDHLRRLRSDTGQGARDLSIPEA